MVIGHSGAPAYVYRLIYAFHMPCFFIISGMLFKEKYVTQTSTFIKHRLKGLWWPYVKWNLVFLLLHNLLYQWHIYGVEFSFKYMCLKTWLIALMYSGDNLTGGFWFLKSLLLASILSILYFRFVGYTTKKLLIGTLAFFLLAWIFCTFRNINNSYISYVTFEATVYFFVGALLQRLPALSRTQNYTLLSSALFIAIYLAYLRPYADAIILNMTSLPLYVIGSCVISFAVISIIRKAPECLVSQKIAVVGNFTLDILVWHFLAFKVVSFLIIKLHDLPIEHMSDFPIISEYSHIYWPLYAIAGVGLSLSMGLFIRKIQSRVNPWVKNFSWNMRKWPSLIK